MLTDPRSGTNDSTAAIQKLFLSLQGAHYPPGPPTTRPAVYNSFTIRLLGIYGISDEIKVNPGGYHIGGSGVGLLGSGFKWVGPDEEENKTKAMLRLFGPQWVEIDGLIFLGLPTETDENRLYAGVALQSTGNVPPPFYSEFGRRTTIRRCIFSDTVCEGCAIAAIQASAAGCAEIQSTDCQNERMRAVAQSAHSNNPCS